MSHWIQIVVGTLFAPTVTAVLLIVAGVAGSVEERAGVDGSRPDLSVLQPARKGETAMQLDQCKKSNLKVVSSKEHFGFVLRCPNGCVHVCVGNTALRLSEDQYWILMEMLGEASTKIASAPDPHHDVQAKIQ